ncbi:MAG: retropepsin-like aspartic protease [Nocardioides sp.]
MPDNRIAFNHVGHLIRVPATGPNGSQARFLIDTGIGISLVSSDFAHQHQLTQTGRTITGQRMAGDEVTAPLVNLPRLELGSRTLSDLVVAVADLGADMDGSDFDGILGLDALGHLPLTIDPFEQAIDLAEPDGRDRWTIPARLQRNGESVAMFVQVALPDGTPIDAELDTGSEVTILDLRYLPHCQVTATDVDRHVFNTNETGHEVERLFVDVPGPISLAAAPQTVQSDSTVMFQSIIHDGLIGTRFLNRYVQTYDTRTATLALVEPH